MPKITVRDKTGEIHTANVDAGIDLMDACEEAGVVLGRSCGRGSQCATCAVTIIKGEIGTTINAMEAEEIETMEKAGLNLATQVLACACQVYDDIEVEEAGCEDVQFK